MSTPNLSVVLGSIIRTERTARRMTQLQVAAAASVHPMAISKIERGTQRDIGVETIRRIAVALSSAGSEVTASGLVAGAERWLARMGTREHELTGGALAASLALGDPERE